MSCRAGASWTTLRRATAWYDCVTMVPETRLCAYCKSKIAADKRADAKFCSHACKLSAHRKEGRAAVARKDSVPAVQPVVTKPIDAPSVLAPQDHIHFIHPTRFPLTIEELENVLLQNARPSAIGYRLGIEVDSRKHGRVQYLYPSFVKASMRFDGTEKLWPCFRLRPFEPPVIPMEGIYSVHFMDKAGLHIKGGQGVANGVRLAPFRYVANIKDGDRKRIRDRD